MGWFYYNIRSLFLFVFFWAFFILVSTIHRFTIFNFLIGFSDFDNFQLLFCRFSTLIGFAFSVGFNVVGDAIVNSTFPRPSLVDVEILFFWENLLLKNILLIGWTLQLVGTSLEPLTAVSILHLFADLATVFKAPYFTFQYEIDVNCISVIVNQHFCDLFNNPYIIKKVVLVMPPDLGNINIINKNCANIFNLCYSNDILGVTKELVLNKDFKNSSIYYEWLTFWGSYKE